MYNDVASSSRAIPLRIIFFSLIFAFVVSVVRPLFSSETASLVASLSAAVPSPKRIFSILNASPFFSRSSITSIISRFSLSPKQFSSVTLLFSFLIGYTLNNYSHKTLTLFFSSFRSTTLYSLYHLFRVVQYFLFLSKLFFPKRLSIKRRSISVIANKPSLTHIIPLF